MSFAEVLAAAATKSYNDRRQDYSEVMDTLVSVQCPTTSPKELMDKLRAQMTKSLNRKNNVPTTWIDDIYTCAKNHVGVQNLDKFIQLIEADLDPRYVEFFKSAQADPDFKKVMDEVMSRVNTQLKRKVGSASINSADGSTNINLACRLQQTTGDSVEDAIRSVFFDIRKARKFNGRADLVVKDINPGSTQNVVGNKIVEIKYSRGGFASLATDSQALVPNPKKWYLYVTGDVPMGTSGTLKAWFINSEDLYAALLPSTEDDLISPIDPMGNDALRDIEIEIDTIKNSLAQAILNKSTPAVGEDREPVQMSLQRKIGVNRVRFDIKFESLIRSTIREILRS